MSTLGKRIRPLFDQIYNLKVDGNQHFAPVFASMPDRKLYPDYYEIIKTPMTLNAIRKKINHYTTPNEFIRDLVIMVLNAETYNEKGSYVYNCAEVVNHFIMTQVIPKLKRHYSEVSYPHLTDADIKIGVPPVIGSGPANNSGIGSANPNMGMNLNINTGFGVAANTTIGTNPNAVYEEYDRSNSNSGFSTPTVSTIKKIKLSTGHMGTAASHVVKEQSLKRGRPPVIDKPYEQRIKNVLRNLKREKDIATGELLYVPFDRLPDPREYPDYYRTIQTPISLDEIRKKIKQRKYRDVLAFVSDVKTMFKNAKYYNEEGSKIFKYALKLENSFDKFVMYEMKKPDTDYIPAESLKIPLDQLELRGKLYKIGDWLLINNPNDPQKPIVAQLFRIWETTDGKRWINVCWYLRPEQTVHRVDRIFYENEVVKSGQYRDHLAEEVIGKCYVAYFTRYQRGDPAIPYEGPLFICEYRYNDNDKNFNKIRTWRACLPDEVRDHEDPITPFPNLRIFKKIESPLKHLLPPNATVNMPIPEPTIGAPNAPPLYGAVYLREIDDSDDLGQYSTSRHCPKYIIRPNDPNSGNRGTNIPVIPNRSFNNNNQNGISQTASPIPQHHLHQQSPFAQQQLTPQQYQSPLQPNNRNSVYHASTNYVPSSTSTSYILPFNISNSSAGLIRMDSANNKRRLQGISEDIPQTGPIIWFRAPSVSINSRIQPDLPFEPLNRISKRAGSTKDDDEDDFEAQPGNGIGGAKTIGHSAAYIAFKLQKESMKE